MVSRGTRAAGGQATDHWVLGNGPFKLESMDWSEGRPARHAEIAAEFVRMKVDVIVTNGTAVPTVKQATSVIPIVFPMGIDPVGSDLIRSLAQPGGNVTGVTTQQSDLAGKRLELLREVLPRLRRLATIGNVGNTLRCSRCERLSQRHARLG